MVILLENPIKISQLREFLTGNEIVAGGPARERWHISGPYLLLKFLPELGGVVSVDVVDELWPDGMGGPQEPDLFAAWGMGWFGPFAFPGNLERATFHARWRWTEAAAVVKRHKAFIRIRSSYSVFSSNPDPNAPCLPSSYDPLQELPFLTAIAAKLLAHPAALCYFNPNGEVVLTGDMLEKHVAFHEEHNLPPIDVWSNFRLFDINPQWCLMDTVGNSQLDLPDHEVVFPKERFNADDFLAWLRDLCIYVLKRDRPVEDGDTINGPGGVRWKVMKCQDSLSSPPRETLRWFSVDAEGVPPIALNREREKEPPKAKPKKPQSEWEDTGFERWNSSTQDYLYAARQLYRQGGTETPRFRSLFGLITGRPNAKPKTPDKGVIVWGASIRAFWPCYTAGVNNHWGSVVIGFDPFFEDPIKVMQAAMAVRRVRERGSPIPQRTENFVKVIRDDYDNTERIAVPSVIAGGPQSLLQSILFERQHLPLSYLHHRLVLVLAKPDGTTATLLPLAFWPAAFQEIWKQDKAPLSEEVIKSYKTRMPKIRP